MIGIWASGFAVWRYRKFLYAKYIKVGDMQYCIDIFYKIVGMMMGKMET